MMPAKKSRGAEQSRVGISPSARVPQFGDRVAAQDIVCAIGNNGLPRQP
nr:MAG TPA: hypothetical protein [Caudoviricetes sp.]